MQKGFTLIETIIYIALFSLLIGSAFIITYQLIDGSARLNGKNTVQEEGNFVLRKFNWALTGASSFNVVGNTLVINKYSGSQVRFCLDSDKIKIHEGGNAACSSSSFIPLTTDNVKVSSINFALIIGKPAGVIITFEISNGGVDYPFSITKYIRQ